MDKDMCKFKDSNLGIKKLDFKVKRGAIVSVSIFPDIKNLSNLGFRNNTFSFGERQSVKDSVPVSNPSKGTDYAKVPVIVLLAMNPATLNSAIPAMPETDNPNQIVMLAPKIKANKSAYVLSPQIEQTKQAQYPYGWAYFSTHNILYKNKAIGNGADYTIIYAAIDRYSNKDVSNVYLVKEGQNTSSDPDIPPPNVIRLLYHNIGLDKEFVGAVLYEEIIGKDGELKGTMHREVRLDDDTANHLMLMLADKTNLNNKTSIRLVETDSPSLMKIKTY